MPQLPMETFSSSIQQIFSDVSEAVQSPPDFVCASLLASISSAIGNKLTLQIKPGYTESACLWQVAVGMPSAGKSPSLKFFFKAIEAENLKRREIHFAEQQNKEEKSDYYSMIVNDTTIEALAVALEKNKNGILMYADEFQSFVKGFDQYKKNGAGSEEGTWNSIFSHNQTNIQRKGSKNVFIEKPYVTLIGGTQPEPWKKIRGNESGFIFRFLIYDQRDYLIPDYTMKGISEETINRSKDLIERIMYGINGLYEHTTISLTLEAKDFFLDVMQELTKKIVDYQKNKETYYDSALGKFRQHFARLALCLHVLEFGESDRAEINRLMSKNTLFNSWYLIDKYFMPNALANIDEIMNGGDSFQNLTAEQKSVYAQLNENFRTNEVVQIAFELKHNEVWANRLLTKFINQKLVKKIKHGEYSKL